jgi:SpoVK/Ycf46/Vps4 family AAA+-type ATPase
MSIVKEIIENIQAGIPGLHIVSDEYLRLDNLVSEIADNLKFGIKEWSLGFGQINSDGGNRIDKTLSEFLTDVSSSGLETGRLIYIKNAKLALEENKTLIAHLQQVLIQIQKHYKGQSCVIYTSEERFIPLELSSLVYFMEYTPPDTREITEIIQTYIDEKKYKISSELKRKLIATCADLDKETILQILEKTYSSKVLFVEKDLEIARKAKEQKVSKSGYIEMVPLKESFDDLGGLEELKQYLGRKKIIIDDLASAVSRGILPPKGILLVGLPGCGKSLAAKSAAYLFNLPLLRIDIGSLMGKYVGESENNLKNALRIVEHTNPCVLWLDEIEKAFSGIQGDSGGSGVTTRMFGYFLTWMQEKAGTVFVIATANNISAVPTELWRKGRFDESFFVELPSQLEREQILKIYLDKVKHTDKEAGISIAEIAQSIDGYSGADIHALINDALETSFIEKRKLDSSIIKDSSKKITSLKVMLGNEKIKEYEKLRENFGIKRASWTTDERKKLKDNLENDAISPDPTKRERAAKNPQCPPNILECLSGDKVMSVRRAVFSNPQCPCIILEDYLKKNMPAAKAASNTDMDKFLNMINRDNLFELALSHPSTDGKMIADLYRQHKIDTLKFFELISKRSIDNNLISFFDIAQVALPDNRAQAIVRKYYVSEKSIVHKGSKLVELDDENGSNFILTFPANAIVKEVTVPVNEKVSRNQTILCLYILKDDMSVLNGGSYGK